MHLPFAIRLAKLADGGVLHTASEQDDDARDSYFSHNLPLRRLRLQRTPHKRKTTRTNKSSRVSASSRVCDAVGYSPRSPTQRTNLPLTRSDRSSPGCGGERINIRCMWAIRDGFEHPITARQRAALALARN